MDLVVAGPPHQRAHGFCQEQGQCPVEIHNVLVAGGPGSGKTTFAIQFLYIGITQHNEPGLYITLDEESEDIKKNMSHYGWDLDELEREKKLIFINVSPVRVASAERVGLVQLGMKEFKLIKML